MAALWATHDEDGDGYPDAADTDGDGIPDAEDEDPDNDGCLDEPLLTMLNPHSCGDLDGDGIADGMDPDGDGDGDADLEELTLGADGRFSDHRNDQHNSQQAIVDLTRLCTETALLARGIDNGHRIRIHIIVYVVQPLARNITTPNLSRNGVRRRWHGVVRRARAG